jgi:hypothetical protein
MKQPRIGRYSKKPLDPCPRCYAPMTLGVCKSKGCERVALQGGASR